ncbi:molybdopterin-guanine dinucleotide biosynthesis protein MobA [Serratia plymuthica]|uniref:Molybdopterin-guanine dinucleotide biosynthesis protein MobA n=1 Tax=Serratia plymuthica TaxID=82996 RepID=A0A2X4YFM1_SERPL|nr:molybdopterin-guanine dinucleotide biosynthesis protein MobA [Serratia plymuthica]
MGGEDKGLVQVAGIPLYQHVLARLQPQVGSIAISANRNQARYQESGLPAIGDLTTDFSGPLAGILAGLRYAATEWVVFVPCDVPDFPTTLVEQLWQQKGPALAAYASDGERAHPTLALLHTSLAPQLAGYLARGDRKLMLFLDAAGARQVRSLVSKPHSTTLIREKTACAGSRKKDSPMNNPHPPLLGIAAYSGTGKTTLLKQLIPLLRQRKSE